MTPNIYLRANSGTQVITLPKAAEVTQGRHATPGVRYFGAGKSLHARIRVNTDDPGLLVLAWRVAAEAVSLAPPACPRSDRAAGFELREGDEKLLSRFWQDWLRIVTNLAIRAPQQMEEWATQIATNAQFGLTTAITAILERWWCDHTIDLWHVRHRVASDDRTALPPSLPEAERATPKFFLRALLPSSLDGLQALARVFVWRRSVASDVRPGLLESRWIHWPNQGQPLLSFFLAHPSVDPMRGKFKPSSAVESRA